MMLIRQPKNCCGQTCVAMIAGITVDEAVKLCGKRGLTGPKMLIRAFRRLGIVCADRMRRISRRSPKTGTCIVRLRKDGLWKTHFVVYHNGKYYDPENGVLDRPPGGWRETSFLAVWPEQEGRN